MIVELPTQRENVMFIPRDVREAFFLHIGLCNRFKSTCTLWSFNTFPQVFHLIYLLYYMFILLFYLIYYLLYTKYCRHADISNKYF